jgi:hypothetical protein
MFILLFNPVIAGPINITEFLLQRQSNILIYNFAVDESQLVTLLG